MKALVTNKEAGGIFPDIDKAVCEFEALIKWKQVAHNDMVPEPVPGFDSAFDRVKEKSD